MGTQSRARERKGPRAAVVLACALGGFTPLRAVAQDAAPAGFNAHGFELAAFDADVRDGLVVQRPGVFSQGDWFFGLLGEYAEAPLVLVTEDEAGEQVRTPVLDNVAAFNVSVGVAAHDRLRFDVKAPIYGTSAGSVAGALDGAAAATEPPAMGDIRATTMLVLVRPQHVASGGGGLGLGVVGRVDLPSGTPDRFLGQSGVAGGGSLAITYEAPSVTLSADVGTQFNPALEGFENLNGSDALLANLGLGVLASEQVGINFEAAMAPPFKAPEQLAFPAEGLVSLRYRAPNGAFVTFGGAMGLTSGPGVAQYRAFLGGGFGKQEPARPPDFDPIGRLASTDACPLETETVNGWKDDDGCADKLGALAIDVRFGGTPWQASARIEGPSGLEDRIIPVSGLQVDAVPGSRWTVTATEGCLSGTGAATAAETGSALVVNLEPKYDAHVLVEVVDEAGLPLPDASIVWSNTVTPFCVPPAPATMNTSGMVEQDVASGTHHVVVTAPGHSVVEQDVTLPPGADERLRFQLAISRIRVDKKQIVILEKVMFETAKAIIKPDSFALLDEIATTILDNPDLGRVEVGGHTDSQGSDPYNLKLSQDRADSVRKYLMDKGVPEAQLLAVGYGETVPLDTNKTTEGREKNRRVEFNLIDRKDEAGEPTPTEGGTP